ncbi:UNVERIFIED_CONTAM: hypothetical protein Sradi_3934600 [Sesamum radiatum]|uniref:Uncharacterized protein n=1 Tax=Sesamum radiatum TaxID=300843 RepID=A0AAW2PG47_SESRA
MGEGIPLTLSCIMTPPSSSSSPSVRSIIRKAICFPLKNKKLMCQVFVLILFPFLILVLLHSLIATPLMAKVEESYENSSLDHQDLVSLVATEIPFAFAFSLLLLFASAITTSASISAHQSASLGLQDILLSLKSTWRNLFVSGLYISFLMTAFLGVTVILTRLTTVIGVVSALTYPYLASICNLVLVISTVEDECHWKTAFRRAGEITRQGRFHGYCLMLMLVLLSVPVYVLFYVISTDDDDGNGLITQFGFLLVATVLFCLTIFFNNVVYSLFYLDYKQRNGEKIEVNCRNGSASYDEASQKALEDDLVDAGDRLLALPSSTDELLILLGEIEILLAKVWQKPPRSLCRALLPAMKALITDEILHHGDVNIQVAVASCFNELTRITAPDPPYEDDEMKVFFRLFIIAFKHLPCESGRNYSRAQKILETTARVRSSLMLLDIDSDGLIVEMFQLFLNNIGSNHPFLVFKYMEMIMTLVIEESDEISFELLRPLLASVKMDNKNTSSISWDLGKKVLANCATKVQPYLTEAVKAMNLALEDYAEIVTSICHDTVSKAVAPAVGDGPSQLDGLSKSAHKDGNGTRLDDENSVETLKDRQQIIKSRTDNGALQKRRGRKPSSVIRQQEGYEQTGTTGGKYSGELSSDGYNEEKKDFALPSELGSMSMLSDSSQKKDRSSDEASRPKMGQAKKKKSMITGHNNLQFSSTVKRNILQTKLKERGNNAPKKTGKRALAAPSSIRADKEAGILRDTRMKAKHELLPQGQYGRKEIREDFISHKHVQDDVANKIEELPMSKQAKYPRKEKEKKSPRSRVDYGEELVNLRIQVWWPMDEMFYPGTVKAFDPVTKKHTIIYDDDEREILNLRKETWELVAHEQLRRVRTQEKTAKGKAGSLRKQHAASSSKRSKSENRNIIKNSVPDIIHLNDESNDEKHETNVSREDGGEHHAGKEE